MNIFEIGAGILSASLIFISSVAYSQQEIRLVISTTARENVFSKIEGPFTESTKIKIIDVADIKNSSSVEYIKQLALGKAEGATSSTPISDLVALSRKEGFENPNMDKMTQRLIGRDLMNVYVNKDAGVAELTLEQVTQLFTGKIKSWKEIGGKDIPPKLVLQKGKLGTVGTFKRIALKGEEFAANSLDGGNHEGVGNIVAKTSGAFGMGPLENVPEGGVIVKTPTIGRPIFLYTVGKPSENMVKLIEFINKEGSKFGLGK